MSPLSREEQRCLLELARDAIAAALAGAPLQPETLAASLRFERLAQPGGAFVTLHTRGELRGCVGLPLPYKPLYQAVASAAVSAALHDPRFPPVEAAELPGLEIEISVLSPIVPLPPDQVVPGEHGLLVTQGFQRGLLLPQVAREHGWSREQFLEETCAKAGLDRSAWKQGAKVEVFTAQVFSEVSPAAETVPAKHPS